MTTINDSIQVGSLTLHNRLILPPMATEKSENGVVTEELCQYYSERAQGGHIALITTEHNYIMANGQASPHQVSVSRDSDVEGLSKLAKAIKQDGTLAVLQINHAGSAAMYDIAKAGQMMAPSPIANVNPRFLSRYPKDADMKHSIPREMTQEDIQDVITAFANAARRAKEAGFDGVEIHSAHGYLLNQFYSPLMNKRTDAYTGSTIEGRTKLQVEVIKAVRDVVGQDFFVSIRLGAIDDMEGGSLPEDAKVAAKIFQDAGVDMISISGCAIGFMRPGHQEEGWFQDGAKWAKEGCSIPVTLTGGIKTVAGAEELLNNGSCDLVGVGRPILADPTYSAKLTKGI